MLIRRERRLYDHGDYQVFLGDQGVVRDIRPDLRN
jgi:hypothetical protein